MIVLRKAQRTATLTMPVGVHSDTKLPLLTTSNSRAFVFAASARLFSRNFQRTGSYYCSATFAMMVLKPANAAEEHYQQCAECCHQQKYSEITKAPVQLRHVVKIHAVNAYNQGVGHENN